ncbi:heparinase II/III family protein [Bartonella ancashensis]|uniref:heparinase II/III family protein n=1 Tax=Bartonella ancashensis TaxID=1318743 RepID=UPI0039E4228B
MTVAIEGFQIKILTFVYNIVSKFLQFLWVGPLFYWRFSGFRPQKILVHPIDLRIADSGMAHEFYHGRFTFAGRIVQSGSSSPFSCVSPTAEWERALHDFHWLRHMTAAKSQLATAHARFLIEDWLDHTGKKARGLPWEGAVVARRLIAWVCHSQMLLDGASSRFEKRFLHTLGFHFRYLRIIILGMKNNDHRLHVAIAIAFASLTLPVSAAIKKKAQACLVRELSRQILTDGGHISRNPAVMLNILPDLLSLRRLYINSQDIAPRVLIDTVERMLPALRFFVHEDKTLAHFNGVGPISPEFLSSILKFDETTGNSFGCARYSGFQRLHAHQTTVLADTGRFPAHFVAEHACSGCLSFEMSSRGSRFIINAGVDPYGHEDYRHFGRITAAHSTATLNDCSVGVFRKAKNKDVSFLLNGPTDVKVQRIEDTQKIGFIACHNGYLSSFDLLHERGLILTTDGEMIEGFDRFFTPCHGNTGKNGNSRDESNIVAVRFHLHPKVEVNYDGNSARLAVAGGAVWNFVSLDTDIYLEDSIDFAELTGPQRTQQIVLYFRPALQEKVRWRFVRLESK